jgi:hypothetical protein
MGPRFVTWKNQPDGNGKVRKIPLQNLWRRAADGLTPGRCETDQGAAE